MSFLDSILKQVGGSPDTVADLASKVGIDPAMVEKGLAALGVAHDEDGDTVELAAKKTGMDTGTLGSIMEQMGGASGLGDMVGKLGGAGGLGGLTSMLDRDGDGNPLNDLTGMLGGGKK